MECNKEEAAKAKEIAEKKFTMKDISGAKNFALKAQKICPEMEGVSQMIATFDVYIAAEDEDKYGILNASLHDDHETLKRKYRKLALMLHPDKNKSIGAEGAFNHVFEAWKFLSDKKNREDYDRMNHAHRGMECNKEEAARAKEIAEEKFKMKDYFGAKEYALKARSLFPEMEGVSMMITVFDVHILADSFEQEARRLTNHVTYIRENFAPHPLPPPYRKLERLFTDKSNKLDANAEEFRGIAEILMRRFKCF